MFGPNYWGESYFGTSYWDTSTVSPTPGPFWDGSYWGSSYFGPDYWGTATGPPSTSGPMPLDCYGAVLQSLDADPLGMDADQAVQTG